MRYRVQSLTITSESKNECLNEIKANHSLRAAPRTQRPNNKNRTSTFRERVASGRDYCFCNKIAFAMLDKNYIYIGKAEVARRGEKSLRRSVNRTEKLSHYSEDLPPFLRH
ncbi:hypothetical protein EVAR_25746_1 [Eumeta japonica]|uniref:Uncharacterized protein n=1 Tax=Eumeta variegata TaxID=151549 RepID=A0A4C1V8S8_EUMVA|nr:hypothetical protein EVAR_25746_1 [Eumeta japonica]